MKSHAFVHDTAVAAVYSSESERIIRWYAEMLTGQRNRRVCAIRRSIPASESRPSRMGGASPDSLPAAFRQLSRADTIGMIVCDWPATHAHMQTLLHLADERNVPLVAIRQNDLSKINRVVVATAGGPNVLEMMWIAKKIAAAFDVPACILRCRPADPDLDASDGFKTIPFEGMGVRILGMQAAVETSNDRPFAQCVAAFLRQNDLLVLGAPSPLRRNIAFAESVPDQVARTISSPVVLLSSPPISGVDLRSLFWGGLIKTGARFRDKKGAIAGLIQNLAHHNQLPRSGQNDILDRALQREKIMSTAVDCETAFPHVTLRGSFGLTATMAVCPDGVAFGSADGQPTRFLYLMVTSEGLYEDYLATLARIAKRMTNPEVRKNLLACGTPAQVLDILESPAAAPSVSAHVLSEVMPQAEAPVEAVDEPAYASDGPPPVEDDTADHFLGIGACTVSPKSLYARKD